MSGLHSATHSPPPFSDPPGAEAGRGVHRGHGGRGDPVRAAVFPSARRDREGGRLLPPRLPIHRRHRPGQPAGPGRLHYAHCGETHSNTNSVRAC